jgi:catechol 2,3-dioxygenase-like lactoylglutathione lyase family enzyme
VSIRSITPQLRTTNLEATLQFYTAVLGFTETFRFQDFYAGVAVGVGEGVEEGAQQIHLKQVDERDPSIDTVRRDGHLHLYFEVPDIDAFAARLVASGVRLVQPPHDTSWGCVKWPLKTIRATRFMRVPVRVPVAAEYSPELPIENSPMWHRLPVRRKYIRHAHPECLMADG